MLFNILIEFLYLMLGMELQRMDRDILSFKFGKQELVIILFKIL